MKINNYKKQIWNQNLFFSMNASIIVIVDHFYFIKNAISLIQPLQELQIWIVVGITFIYYFFKLNKYILYINLIYSSHNYFITFLSNINSNLSSNFLSSFKQILFFCSFWFLTNEFCDSVYIYIYIYFISGFSIYCYFYYCNYLYNYIV